MKFKVEMLAFGEGQIREVTIPEGENATLDTIYYYGQNDFQPLEHPSVSMGDVINFDNKKWLVAGIGFTEMTDDQYTEYLNTDRRDRLRLHWRIALTSFFYAIPINQRN